MSDNIDLKSRNRILAALPAPDYKLLSPHLQNVFLFSGQVVYTPEKRISEVYFPTSCLLSIVALLENGETVEAGMVGNEGMLGIPIVLGSDSTTTEAVVLASGEALRMSAKNLKTFIDNDGLLNKLLLRYTNAFLTQVAQTAACNRAHTLNERLSRWLLLTHDRVQRNSFELTHEFLANMLGTRRAGVSVAAKILKDAGLVDYTRGHMHILDRPGLEEMACECYRVVRDESERDAPN